MIYGESFSQNYKITCLKDFLFLECFGCFDWRIKKNLQDLENFASSVFLCFSVL